MRIVELCRTVEAVGSDPFDVNIIAYLEKLKKYLPHWKFLDELLLDAEAIARLSSIIKLQGDWIRHRSSTLYVDPLLVELKIRMLEARTLSEAFSKCWHPIVMLEQISTERLREAMDYWNQLPPLGERWREDFSSATAGVGHLSIDDLVHLKVLSLEDFGDGLKEMHKELRDRIGKDEKMDYWDFIRADDFEGTLERAYLASFLVTEGRATIAVDPVEERIFIAPLKEKAKEGKPRSVPISIDYRAWSKTEGEDHE